MCSVTNDNINHWLPWLLSSILVAMVIVKHMLTPENLKFFEQLEVTNFSHCRYRCNCFALYTYMLNFIFLCKNIHVKVYIIGSVKNKKFTLLAKLRIKSLHYWLS